MALVSDIAVFCISLRDSPRRAVFAAAAAAHAVAFEFFDAITPADLRQGRTIDGCRIDITDLRWTEHERLDPRRQRAPLLFAEIGCAYSHLACWQIGRARNLDRICVFEDDAIICCDPRGIDMPDGADILYLNQRIPHDANGEITDDVGGTEGYLLSRSGISKCLDIFSVLYMPIDLQLVAHQARRVQKDGQLSAYRRERDSACTLNARVAGVPCCVLSDDTESQIYDSAWHGTVAERNRLRLERELLNLAAERDRLDLDLRAALHRPTGWRLPAPLRAIGAALARATGRDRQ